MDRPVFKPIQVGGDGKVDRIQVAIAKALGEVVDNVEEVRSPGVAKIAGDLVVTDERIVDYRGRGGNTIRLPEPDAGGTGVGRAVVVLNNGAGAITLSAGARLINGAKTMAVLAGVAVLAQSNGDKLWSAVGSAGLAGHVIQQATTPFTQRPALNFTGAAVVTDNAVNGSTDVQIPSSVPVTQPWFSIVDQAAAANAYEPNYILTGGGIFTQAIKFSSSQDIVCSGVRFFWKLASGSVNIRCKVWRIQRAGGANTGVVIASGTTSVSSTGIHSVSFTPITLAKYVTYIVSTYETASGTVTYIDTTGGTGLMGNVPIIGMIAMGPYTYAHTFARFKNADDTGFPDQTGGGNNPVEPIFASTVIS